MWSLKIRYFITKSKQFVQTTLKGIYLVVSVPSAIIITRQKNSFNCLKALEKHQDQNLAKFYFICSVIWNHLISRTTHTWVVILKPFWFPFFSLPLLPLLFYIFCFLQHYLPQILLPLAVTHHFVFAALVMSIYLTLVLLVSFTCYSLRSPVFLFCLGSLGDQHLFATAVD